MNSSEYAYKKKIITEHGMTLMKTKVLIAMRSKVQKASGMDG